MADSLDINFHVNGLAQAVGGMNQMAGAVGGIAIPGAGAVSGIAAISSALAALPAPAAAAVAALVAVGVAIAGVAAVAVTAAHSLQSFGTLQATLASNAHDTAFLQLAGQLTGQNAGAAASSVRQGAFSGNGALAYSSLGINLPPPIDTNGAFDEGANLMKVLSALTRQFGQDSSLALMNLRRLHLEGFAPLIEGGPQVSAMLEKEARLREQINTPQHIASAILFNTQLEVLKARFVDLAVTYGPMVFGALEWVMKGLEEIATLGIQLYNLLPGHAPIDASGLQRTQDAHTQAMQNHTAAMNESVRAQRFGQFGGGAGFRSAIPGGYQNSVQAGQALQGQAAQWGAYALGM